jgi:hypothetical protein
MGRLRPGLSVRVVAEADETLRESGSRVGRRGRVLRALPRQGVGDDPPGDPMWLVDHGRAGTFPYWTEELAPR